ncbi:MAG: AP endonuclease [Spirochaetaceae bacterium]|jgi:sugar phosphate isomerase/epimerase|nr:AP endonuclease [Spirochaetaceae bacterium]
MRVSVPSWVIPGTYAENLRFLAEKREITGVELLFFIYDDETKQMLRDEWDVIRSYTGRFTYTVHLPDRILPEHAELVERFLPYARNFVVHPYPAEEADAERRLLEAWQASYGNADRRQEDLGALSPFIIENTYPGMQEALLSRLPGDTGLVMDTGHLLLIDHDPAGFFNLHKTRVKEIHLHTVDFKAAQKDNRLTDHRSLKPDDPWFIEFVSCLREFTGVVNLEVFSWEEAAASLAVLRGAGLLE